MGQFCRTDCNFHIINWLYSMSVYLFGISCQLQHGMHYTFMDILIEEYLPFKSGQFTNRFYFVTNIGLSINKKVV